MAAPKTANALVKNFKIIWAAILMTEIFLVASAFFVRSSGSGPAEIVNLAEVTQSIFFKTFSSCAVICLVLSRYLPGLLFKRALDPFPNQLSGDEKEFEIMRRYTRGFIVGLALLEAICIFGVLLFKLFGSPAVLFGFFIFSFLNTLIRFPMKAVILKNAEDVLNPHAHLKVY